MYHPDEPIVTYCNSCWWSDEWDPFSYACDVDFSRPFFEQMREMLSEVPWMALGVDQPTIVNSPYCNGAGRLKNAYLVFFADYVEDSYYCDTGAYLKNCFDCYMTYTSEHCYECVNMRKCYRAFYSLDCEDSYDIYFSKNLVGCSDCFGCTNLRKKRYCIFNEEYSKDEYEKKLGELKPKSYSEVTAMLDRTKNESLRYPQKYMHGRQNVEVTGDYVFHSKNSKVLYQSEGVEDSKYLFLAYLGPVKDCYDYSFYGDNAIEVYETIKSGTNLNRVFFSNGCFPEGRSLDYCHYCVNSHDLFGCVGLRNKEYCIFNKQYTKEEYLVLRKKIIEHMNTVPYVSSQGSEYRYGEFFPFEFSPFTYNESIIQEVFPLSKEQAIAQGFRWRDPEDRGYNVTLKNTDLPGTSSDIDDSILNQVIECTHRSSSCSQAFKIHPEELKFLKQMYLPIPRRCPNCRHAERLQKRNPMRLYTRTCMHKDCSNEFETSYAPERPEIVYCEDCYKQEVV